MKRFEFSLKKLYQYKEQVLKKEKNSLGELRKQQLQLIEDKKMCIIKKGEKCRELNGQINKGLSPQHIALHKNYIDSLDEKILNFAFRIENLENSIQKQLELIIELTKEIDSLEKLEGKQLEEYKKIELKQNELFIEEFVSHSTFTKN